MATNGSTPSPCRLQRGPQELANRSLRKNCAISLISCVRAASLILESRQ
ncbi:Uncharacterised protein [Mycobacteroides abscessus subsp. abscessus]|nr:Uncharacterised protein [Mycobacteroides abscessus subsp. abscessus]